MERTCETYHYHEAQYIAGNTLKTGRKDDQRVQFLEGVRCRKVLESFRQGKLHPPSSLLSMEVEDPPACAQSVVIYGTSL